MPRKEVDARTHDPRIFPKQRAGHFDCRSAGLVVSGPHIDMHSNLQCQDRGLEMLGSSSCRHTSAVPCQRSPRWAAVLVSPATPYRSPKLCICHSSHNTTNPVPINAPLKTIWLYFKKDQVWFQMTQHSLWFLGECSFVFRVKSIRGFVVRVLVPIGHHSIDTLIRLNC